MRDENGYFIWNKGDIYKFNKYFSSKEFDCQCKNSSCIEQKVSKELINKLTELREAVNEPLVITSGFRCEAHQEEIRKSGQSTVVAQKSQHELGNAADIKPTRISIKDLISITEKFFTAIGIAKNFIHIDTRNDKVRRWSY